ncbi:hypothetical protein ACEPAH_7028 [Sanghuangporus vaninii]
MRIRYHAQRKHVIYSLDGLLYELHTLSFLLAPSVFVLLCRCITQFQFSRARELDGRRSLRFWFVLVALVNVSAVWAHAFGSAGGGGGGGGGHGVGEEKSVLLDFVGMGHRPTKLQLLLLDATIMFLQAILTTISYETSLSHAMPSDVPDPLFPAPSSIGSEFSSEEEETAPFLPYSSPDTSAIAMASSATAYPPTPPIPTSSSSLTHADASTDQPPSSSLNNNDSGDDDGNSNSNSNSKPTPHDPLPPPLPIIDLTLRHIIHRLTSPIPELPSLRAGAAAANEGLDGGDDELAVLRLPLPNTTTVRVAHTLRIFAQARQRQRQREREQQQAARRLRRASRADGGGGEGGNGNGNGNGNGADGEGRGPGRGGSARNREGNGDGGGGEDERPRTARIPGAIEDEDEG